MWFVWIQMSFCKTVPVYLMVKEEKAEKRNFDFVDTIRCISMIGIVFEHCTMIGEAHYADFYSSVFQASVMQFFKFATIAFFLIAGFLINHKFREYTPMQYMKNRFRNTIGPWVFWLNVFILLNLNGLLFKYLHRRYDEIPVDFLAYIGDQYTKAIFYSSYWFILNFLICIAILLLFKRYIYSLYFGALLALTSIFYSVNLYYGWITTSHTTALFGFVFYLWLGAFMNKHYDVVDRFIKKTAIWSLVVTTGFFFVFAVLESVYLKDSGIKDAYNTLRITNIFYSLSFFLLLLKIGPIHAVNKYLQPRSTTFGIYLLHQIVIFYILTEIMRPLKISMNTITLIGDAGYSILRFLVTYAVSMLLVMLLRRTRFRWSLGL